MLTKMTAADAVDLVQFLTKHGIPVHVDGGWAVDALLGEQTRPHGDLDIAMPHKDVPTLRALMASRGYAEIARDDSWACNFVLADGAGRELDVHTYTFDEQGNCIFGLPYPVDSLTGTGTIDGHPVDCISPEWLVRFHMGYELDENDYRDVSALCKRFGIALPDEYDEFVSI